MEGNLRRIFGRNVRALRKRAGLTLEELSSRAGIHPNYLGEVERGAGNISLDNMGKLAGALGVSVAELFSGGAKPKAKDALPRSVDLLTKSLRANSGRDQLHVLTIARLISRRLAAKK